MELVIDASVATQWFFPEEKSAAASAIFEEGATLIAPDLIVSELTNVCLKKISRREATLSQARAAYYSLDDILDDLVPTRALALPALEIAVELNHPAYDCFYIALAQARGVEMVTADRRLSQAAASSRWGKRIRLLGT